MLIKVYKIYIIMSIISRHILISRSSARAQPESLMSSVMTLDSLDELGLKEGDKVKVVVKAVNVLLVKE